MAIYTNIITETITTLIEKDKQVSGGITKILISNNSPTTACDVSVFLDDGVSEYYIVKAIEMPIATSLVLEDNLAFNANVYDLKITTADPAVGGSTVDLSVTIK